MNSHQQHHYLNTSLIESELVLKLENNIQG